MFVGKYSQKQIQTSLGLKVWNAMHDDMMKEKGFVVDLDVSGKQATEVLHISKRRGTEDQRVAYVKS